MPVSAFVTTATAVHTVVELGYDCCRATRPFACVVVT